MRTNSLIAAIACLSDNVPNTTLKEGRRTGRINEAIVGHITT
ncbi:MAG: hypothetical protein ACIWVG_27415 [Gloeotrichia echinulata HAB0833]